MRFREFLDFARRRFMDRHRGGVDRDFLDGADLALHEVYVLLSRDASREEILAHVTEMHHAVEELRGGRPNWGARSAVERASAQERQLRHEQAMEMSKIVDDLRGRQPEMINEVLRTVGVDLAAPGGSDRFVMLDPEALKRRPSLAPVDTEAYLNPTPRLK